ncbi:MAG: metal-dependent hydrolase [Pirellulaceae bacterium]|nr:metal-dependent hydrolase [Pirellulaceae bacterium]
MTTPEHSLVGIHAAIAVGAHQRFGWAFVALAGIASNLPDWDGLPMLFDMARFEHGHRVWGHNVTSIALSSLIVATLQYRFHLIETVATRLKNYLPKEVTIERARIGVPFIMLFLICAVVQTIHLPCDMVVSGGNGLSDWHIKPFWPISDVGYVFPLIPWGDIGPTIIMMCGVLLMVKYPKKLPLQSIVTLTILCCYLLIRGWTRGML